MRGHKLAGKVRVAFFIIGLLLMVGLSITISVQYYWKALIDASNQAFAYAKTAVEYVDGDMIGYYAETMAEDDYYNEVKTALEIIIKNTDIESYYVFVPYDDYKEYIWDVGKGNEVRKIGYQEEYEDKEIIDSVFQREPEQRILVSNLGHYGDVRVSAYTPVFDSEGNPVALVGVDLSVEDLVENIKGYVLTIIISIAVIILVAIGFFSRYVNKKVVKPIRNLNNNVNEMVANIDSNDVKYEKIHTGDEIEELSEAFYKMDRDMRDYISKLTSVTAEKERISTELSLAQNIQADMLPCIFPAFPDRNEFKIYATMDPAKEVGGDFYDFFLVDDDHMAMVIADVSGKGVPAALFMVIAKTLIKNRAIMGGTPSEILESVNNQLCEGNKEQLFVTVWLAILDIPTGKGFAANAGHEHPVIKRAGDNHGFEFVKYKHSPVVAAMENMKFEQHEFELKPGDKLYVYTDGVLEATNEKNEMYGEERLLRVLNSNSNNNESLENILYHVKADVDMFVGNAPQFDDITMLGFEYIGCGNA